MMHSRKLSTEAFIFFIIISLLSVVGCGGGGSSSGGDTAAPETYAISGTVSGDIIADVTIHLSGSSTSPVTTDANGNYSFTGLANGTYTAIPVSAGYTFNQVSTAITLNGANVTGIDFAATANILPTYSISGTVSGDIVTGVPIYLSGISSGSAATDANGNYSLTGLANGTYTATPILAGYTFNPVSSEVVVSGAKVTGVDFVATAKILPTYSVSGKVSGAVTEGVEIYLSGSSSAVSTLTDAEGNYIFTVNNGNYTVIPVKDGYSFSPVSSAVNVSGADIADINFSGVRSTEVLYSISGSVTGSVLKDVLITLGGAASGTTRTNASGNYSFSGLAAGDYTVTPSSEVYTFTPSSLSPTIIDADITDQDFTAAVTFAQEDLEGDWRIHVLNSDGGWFRGTISMDETGTMEYLVCEDSSGGSSCPSDEYTYKLTMDEDGVILLSFDDVEVDSQYRMTLNKNLFAGASTPAGPGSENYVIAQKIVPGTLYEDTDLQEKPFVMHQFQINEEDRYEWQCMTGNLNEEGDIYVTSINSPGMSFAFDAGILMGGSLLVDSSGVVTVGGDDPDESFKGFLSEDKKTIVGTSGYDADEGYGFMVIQITDPDPFFALGPVPAGVYSKHLVGFDIPGDTGLYLVHSLLTVSNSGIFSHSDWVTSNPLMSAPTGNDYISIVSPSGTVKKALNSSYHGQISSDGMFIVGTQTHIYLDGDELFGFYSLGIDILTNGAVTP